MGVTQPPFPIACCCLNFCFAYFYFQFVCPTPPVAQWFNCDQLSADDFPDGLEIDETTGIISGTPTTFTTTATPPTRYTMTA